MKIFSESKEFRKLNVGFALDESITNEERNKLTAFHGEKTSRREYLNITYILCVKVMDVPLKERERT